MPFEAVNGRDLLRQSIIDKCIFEVTKEREGYKSFTISGVLDYMYYFRSNCTQAVEEISGDKCGDKLMSMMGIYKKGVHECFLKSFEEEGNLLSNNKMLREDQARFKALGVIMDPMISINNITYRGYMEGKDIVNAICASFSETPTKCKQL